MKKKSVWYLFSFFILATPFFILTAPCHSSNNQSIRIIETYEKFQEERAEKKEAKMAPERLSASLATPLIVRQTSSSNMYTIVLGEELDYRDAEMRKEELDRLGYFPVELIPDEDDTYSLLVGRFPSSPAASDTVDSLQKEGFFGGEVISLTEAGIEDEEEFLFEPDPETDPRDIYRVYLGSFAEQEEAIEHQNTIEMEGYYPVEVISEDGEWNVYLGRYDSRSLAQEVENSVRQEGFLMAEVVQYTEEVTEPTPRERRALLDDPADIEREIERAREIGDDILYVQQLERLLHTSLEQDRIIEELREAVRQLDEVQRQRLVEERRREEEERRRQANIRHLHRQAFHLLEQREPREALTLWEQILEIDPDNSQALLYMQMAREQISELEERTEREEERAVAREDIDLLINEGLEHLSEDNLEDAEIAFRQVLSMDSNNIEARQALQQIAARRSSQPGDAGISQQFVIPIAGILIGIFFLILVFLFIRYRQISIRDRKLLEQVQQLSSKTAGTGKESSEPTGSDKVTPPPASSEKVAPPPESPKDAVKEDVPSDKRTGENSKPPEEDEKTSSSDTEEEVSTPGHSPDKASEGTSSLKEEKEEEVNISKSKEIEIEPQETPDSFEESVEDEIMSIGPEEETSDQEGRNEEVAEDEDTESLLDSIEEEEAESLAEEKTEEELDELFKTSAGARKPEDTTPEKSESPTENKLKDSCLFQQDFEKEEVGKLPQGWEGGYDYASLKVVDNIDCLSGQKCAQYEKVEPKGTAYFYRPLEPLSGTFVFEFDFRCDHKNKYLLGIYLEKDRDFRQSIHTILYMVNPKDPKLRLHGESIPYKLSTWKTIRYEIDLNDKSLEGYIDGEHVATKKGLPDALDYINTLSIRDNLGTTALMYLNNVKAMKK